MLKTRIIPTLLWKNHSLVKSIKYENWRHVGHVVPSIKIYNARNVDEIIFLNITNQNDTNLPDYNLVEDVASNCFVPLTIGGNIKNIYDVQKIIEKGADKISINSILENNINIIKEIAKNFGSQAIVASIDVRKINDKYYCFSHAGKKKLKFDPLEQAKKVQDLGAGEILLNSIDNDGKMLGYDLNIIQSISKAVNIPVIASGGAGNYEHMYQAISAGASAVSAASIFHFTELTPEEAKKYLEKKGILVRKSL
tara:strand:+ start:831 stop:1589 length:759 start_codon:yes stop_codon:yes gene_type:complete